MMIDTNQLPWIPLRTGLSFKPIRFFRENAGWMLLLKVEPGTVIGRHRHTGEVHAYHLEGQRKLLDTGEVLGAGTYLHEPAGNLDDWMAVGDKPLIAHVSVLGVIEYVDDQGKVTKRASAEASQEIYRKYCSEHSLVMADLTE
jgi:2,4'-dihydroxyacetophenone dioxygenase